MGEEEYDYDENSVRGPSEWGNLRPEWALCKDGRMQSPVDLTNVTVELVLDSEKVYTYYQPSNTTLLNRGHDISVSTSTSFNFPKAVYKAAVKIRESSSATKNQSNSYCKYDLYCSFNGRVMQDPLRSMELTTNSDKFTGIYLPSTPSMARGSYVHQSLSFCMHNITE